MNAFLRVVGDVGTLSGRGGRDRSVGLLVRTRNGQLAFCGDDTGTLKRTGGGPVAMGTSVLDCFESIHIKLAAASASAIVSGSTKDTTLIVQPVTAQSRARALKALCGETDDAGHGVAMEPQATFFRKLATEGDAVVAANVLAASPGRLTKWGLLMETRGGETRVRALLAHPFTPMVVVETKAQAAARRATEALMAEAEKAAMARRRRNTCINNLRQMDSAKEQWAMAQNRRNDAPIDKAGVCEYIKNRGRDIVCPDGGTYTWGNIGEDPACSQPDHRFP